MTARNRVKTRIIVQSVIFLLLAVCFLAGGGYIVYRCKAGEVERAMRIRLSRDLQTVRSLILAELEEPVEELMYLASLSEATEAFTSIISPEKLADLTSLSRTKKKYDQVRLIDRYGMEAACINYNNGAPYVVPEKQLRFKGARYYFSRANILDAGQIYFSSLDLNVENGKVQTPLKPVIRLATPLFDEEGKRRGLAVLNYFGELLFPYLQNIDLSTGEEIFLINNDGYYLYSRDPEQSWGFMLTERGQHRFQNHFPQAWELIHAGIDGHLESSEGVFSFVTVDPADITHSTEYEIKNDAGTWKIVSYLPSARVSGSITAISAEVSNFVLFLSLGFALVSFAVCKLRMDNARSDIVVEEMTRSYERFVPREFLQLLEKERYRDITLESNVRKTMGILFSDIRSYTRISESMEPEEVLDFLNAYFKGISRAISDNRGFVDSFHGDALLALFPESPDHAVQAALDMRSRLEEFNRNRVEDGNEGIEIGLGLHFGEVTLGTVGTTYRMQATVIGDAVNLASRIESVTKTFKIDIVATGAALEMMDNPDNFHIREIDTVRVKGKEQPVVLYEIFDHDPVEVRKAKMDLKPLMQRGLHLYRAGEFQQALDIFKVCASTCPEDSIPPIYIKRCSTFLRIPPGPGWTGVSPV